MTFKKITSEKSGVVGSTGLEVEQAFNDNADNLWAIVSRLIKDYNPDYNFRGFCKVGDATPAGALNDVYYYTGTAAGTVFGIPNVPAGSFMVYNTGWSILIISSTEMATKIDIGESTVLSNTNYAWGNAAILTVQAPNTSKVYAVRIVSSSAININVIQYNGAYTNIGNIKDNKWHTFSLTDGTDSFSLQNSTGTQITANVDVVIYGLSQKIDINTSKIAQNTADIGYYQHFNLSLINKRIYLYGSFKKNEVYHIKTALTFVGTGAKNMAILDDKNSYLTVFTSAAERDIILLADTSYLQFALGNDITITELSADIVFCSGMKKNEFQNSNAIAQNTADISSSKIAISTAAGYFSNLKQTGTITDWGWYHGTPIPTKAYIGINKQFAKDSILNTVEIYLYSDLYDNNSFQFVIGTVDQRNWLLPRKIITCNAVRKSAQDYIFDFTAQKEIVNQGEYLFICVPINSDTIKASVALVATSYNPSEAVLMTHDLSSPLVSIGNSGMYTFIVAITEIETVLAYKSNIAEISSSISTLQETVLNSSILTDKVTGLKYRLYVANGIVGAKSLLYNKILIIGNSFTIHSLAEGVWYSNGRSMAASVDSTMFASLIAYKMNNTVTRQGAVSFERDHVGFNFSLLGLTNDYDAVIIQLGENTTGTSSAEWAQVTADFKLLYEYVVVTCTNADVFAMIGAQNGAKYNAITSAANLAGIPIIDCVGISLLGSYALGDYVTDDTGIYHYLTNTGVTQGHPSDIGELNMANKILSALGQSEITDREYNITIQNTEGGTITAAYGSWVSDGIVSLRCIADAGKTISNLTVTDVNSIVITATQRTNEFGTYYTFVMPKSDVTVSAQWT